MFPATPSKYRHVLCLFPYYRHVSGLAFFPPTGVEYVAGALSQYVPRVTMVDVAKDPALRTPEQISRFIRDEKVDLICASVNWDYNHDKALALLKELPRHIPLVIGGQTATKDVEEILAEFPDLVALVRGEGEETVLDICSGTPREEILGISYLENGKVRHNDNRPLPPAGDLPDVNRKIRRCTYRVESFGIPVLRGRFDSVLASRGCPFRCKFCTFSLNPLGQKRQYSSRSVESVLKELEEIEAEYVLFADDYFYAEPRRAIEICKGIVERGLQKNFIVNARIEVARKPEMLEWSRKAGIKILLLGIESATDRVLKELNKGFNTDKVREYVPILKSFGFFNHGYFIYGNIGETEEEMMRIPGFAHEVGLDTISTNKLRAEKFSPIHDDVAKTPGAWIGSSGFVYQPGLDRKNLKRIGKNIINQFYSPGQVWRMVNKALDLDLLKLRDLVWLALISPRVGLQMYQRVQAHKRHKAGIAV